MGEGVDQGDEPDQVFGHRRARPPFLQIVNPQSGRTRIEMDPILTQIHGHLAVPIIEHGCGTVRRQPALVDQCSRDPHLSPGESIRAASAG